MGGIVVRSQVPVHSIHQINQVVVDGEGVDVTVIVGGDGSPKE